MSKKTNEYERKIVTVVVGSVPTKNDEIIGRVMVNHVGGYTALDVDHIKLTDMSAVIDDILKNHKHEYENIRFSLVRPDCYCYDGCNCHSDLSVVGDRLETDLEYEVRFNIMQESSTKQEMRDRMEYERLKKKFGG